MRGCQQRPNRTAAAAVVAAAPAVVVAVEAVVAVLAVSLVRGRIRPIDSSLQGKESSWHIYDG